MALPHSKSVNNVSNGSFRRHTIKVPPQGTVRVTGNEPVTNYSGLRIRPHISKGLDCKCLKCDNKFGRVLAVLSFKTDVGSPLSIRASYYSQWALRPSRSVWRFRHQESHLQGGTGAAWPIRSNYGIKYLSILVPTGRSTQLRDFHGRKRGRPGLSRRWPALAELAVRASARRPRSVIALRHPSGRPSGQPAVG